jgi:putative ABC transport system permease protein
MGLLSGLATRLRLLLSRRGAEERMDAEFGFHLEMETERRVRAGMDPAAARRDALRAFGGVERHREAMRDARGRRLLEDLGSDLRYAGRTLGRSPGFAAVAILTLALGIGAGTAIFSVVNAVLIRPLPVDGLERMVVIREDMPGIGLMDTELAPVEVTDLAARTDLFRAVAGFRATDMTLSTEGDPTRLSGAVTVGDFFGVFGVRPAAGRFYGPEASVAGAPRVAVVSWALWQQLGGGDPAFVGRTIQLDDAPYEVVGVLPAEFRYPRGTQVWRPFPMTEQFAQNRGTLIMTTVAVPRGAPSAAQLQAHLTALGEGWNEQFGLTEQYRKAFHATPFIDYLAGQLRTVMLVLLGAVALVLLIAVANVANLQLLRATGRARELAVRTAMGASRTRVLRQLMVENLVLALAGGAAGVWLGTVALRGLERWSPARELFLSGIPLDARVLALAAGLALTAAVVFGTVPALRASRVEPQEALRETTRGSSHGPGRNRLLKASVVVQVAMAMVLLVGSGLMVRTLARLLATDPGFTAEGVSVVDFAAPPGRYGSSAERSALYRTLVEHVRALPGVSAAAYMWGVPFSGANDSSPFTILDTPVREGEPERHAEARYVSDGVFRTLGIPLLSGRDFSATEVPGQNVSIIDETFAEQFFPGEDPVGRQIEHYIGTSTIIGVVGRVDHHEIADPPKATAYYSTHQFAYVPSGSLLVRSSLETGQVVRMVRDAVRQVDAAIPVYDATTMQGLVARSLGPRRLALLALGAFAALSLLLTALGVYGVMRYTTQERTREIGVRMALGARRGHVVRMVVGQGLAVSLLGALLGLAGALALTRFMAGILFGVSPTDPLTFAGVAALLLAVTVVASWLPARRAAAVNPVRAMRHE